MSKKAASIFFLLFCELWILFFPQSASAVIKEIYNMDSVPSYVNKKTVVFFDIDDTILITATSLGSTPWWNYFMRKMEDEDLRKDPIAKAYIFPMIQNILHNVPLKIIESQTASIIQTFQAKHIPTFALTARHKKAAYDPIHDQRTADQLNRLGIHFENTPLKKTKGISSFFYEGILFSSHGPKGPILLKFIEATKMSPKKIVVIDDNLEQLYTIEESLNRTGISFIGLHYHGAALSVAEFDPLLANIQMQSLIRSGKVLSEEQAQEIAETGQYPSSDFYLDEIIEETKCLINK